MKYEYKCARVDIYSCASIFLTKKKIFITKEKIVFDLNSGWWYLKSFDENE